MVTSPLLIRGFGVRVPGGAPVLTRAFFHSEDRPVCFPGLLTATPTATGSAILARQLVVGPRRPPDPWRPGPQAHRARARRVGSSSGTPGHRYAGAGGPTGDDEGWRWRCPPRRTTVAPSIRPRRCAPPTATGPADALPPAGRSTVHRRPAQA